MDLKKQLYFPVEKIPVMELIPGYDTTSGISHAVVVSPPGGGKRIVNFCSENYQLLKNEDVIPIFQDTISKAFDVEIAAANFGDARFRVDFLLKQKPLTLAKKDLIYPRVSAFNSYDSSRKFSFMAGFYRMVCKNGLMVPEGKVITLKSMHTPKLGVEASFDNIMSLTSEFLANSESLFEDYEGLLYQPVRNMELRVEEIIEETGFPQSLMEDVLFRIIEERQILDMSEYNDWLVYSGFNYQLNHNQDFKAKEQKKEEIDQKILGYLLNY